MSCTINCNALVERVLKCGHKATMECHLKPENQKCKEKVEKTFPFCQHRVEVECYIDVYKEKCPQPCEMPLPECEHLCKGTCGECRNGIFEFLRLAGTGNRKARNRERESQSGPELRNQKSFSSGNREDFKNFYLDLPSCANETGKIFPPILVKTHL